MIDSRGLAAPAEPWSHDHRRDRVALEFGDQYISMTRFQSQTVSAFYCLLFDPERLVPSVARVATT